MTTPISVLRTFETSPSRLFDVWIGSETLIEPVHRVRMDPVVGGELRISTEGDPDAELRGRFLVVERSEHLRYTWRWSGSDEESVVEVWFHGLGSVTVVEVEHAGFLDDASRLHHLDGWVRYLDALPAFF